MMEPDTFNYVIGRPWDGKDEQNLAIYAYHGQIQQGTLQDAERMLAYVKQQNPHRPYRIYLVTFTKLELK